MRAPSTPAPRGVWLLGGLLIAVVLWGYLRLTAFQYAVVQEGWFQYYAVLMQRGLMPYRDFYLFVQPVYPLLIALGERLSDGSLGTFRLYGVVERIVLVLRGSAFLARRHGVLDAFAASLLAAFLYSAFNVDLPYSYYHTN